MHVQKISRPQMKEGGLFQSYSASCLLSVASFSSIAPVGLQTLRRIDFGRRTRAFRCHLAN